MIMDDDTEVGHRRKGSKTKIEERPFNISFLYAGLRSANLPRRRISMEASLHVISYKMAANLVKVDEKFMTKGELMEVELFPLRGWSISKRKSNVISVDLVHATIETSVRWRQVTLLVLAVVIAFVVTLLYFVINSIIKTK